MDSSYTQGYEETGGKKTPGSRNHIFANFRHSFLEKENSYSNLEINLQHVSNDTYLEVHDIKTDLVEKEQDVLKNEIKYQYQDDEEYFGLIATAYEDLNKTDRSKYEYVLPNLVYERNLVSNERIGIVDLYTNAIAKNYRVNQTTRFLVYNIAVSYTHLTLPTIYSV